MKREYLFILIAFLSTVPGLVIKLLGYELYPPLGIITFGMAVVGSAFILSWAAEVAQKDISQNLALVFFALVAILPEYVVDLYFAWTAGREPTYTAYALANMTGANRLLLGLGWFLVVLLFFLLTRKKEIALELRRSSEMFWMLALTLYGFIITIKAFLSVWDTLILFTLFGFYLYHSARTGVLEPELLGPPKLIGSFPKIKRRIITVTMFIFSAISILLLAEPFAESLVQSGSILGIDEFFLVQWLAPLASEAPEFVVVSLLVIRLMPSMALGALVSSMVNQWSLLVGAVPLIYEISKVLAGNQVTWGIALDARQNSEILLTAAQSIFAVSIIINYRFRLSEAGILGLLFFAQLTGAIYLEEVGLGSLIPTLQTIFSATYIFIATILLIKDRGFLSRIVRSTWLSPIKSIH